MRSLARFWPDIRTRLGIYLLVSMLTLTALGLPLVTPIITGRIIDGPVAQGHLGGLWAPVALLLAVTVAEVVALWTRRYLVAGVVSQWEITWRRRLFNHLQYVAVSTHDAWESGQLLSRAVTDMTQMRRFFAFGLPFMVCSPLVIVVGAIVLTVIQPWFGVIILVAAVPTVTMIAVFEQKFRVTSRATQDALGEVTTSVEESIHGLRVIRAFGRSPWMTQRFNALATRVRSLEIHKSKLDSWLWSSMLLLPSLAQVAIVGLGTWGVVQGWTTVGSVVAAVTITMVMRMPIEMLGFLLSDFLMSVTAATRYWEVMDIRLGITDPKTGMLTSTAHAVDDHAPVPHVAGKLTFEDVHFRFPDATQELLRGVNLTIAPGTTLALVGATGSGKSTLAALIPRLSDVTDGRILIDDTDVRDFPVTALRSLVSVSFEDPTLFSASVAANVRLGRPEASDAEVWQALRITQAAGFVEDLPDGIDTQVGEQGLSLSGGQRQRIALARAIIGTPRILVLDDPLSAVDVETEDRVQAALADVLPDSTTIIVAHRPSTAALADQVAVLDGGVITQVGTHAHLLETSAYYRSLMGGDTA